MKIDIIGCRAFITELMISLHELILALHELTSIFDE